LERLSLGPGKRLSTWASETYDAEITLDHALIDANGTIYGKPTPNPAAILQFTANGTAAGRVLGGIFGPNGENAGALLDASNANTVEFCGDFVARRTP